MNRSEETPQDTEESRRGFLKTGIKGVALLPYVAPLVETIYLKDALGHNSGGSPVTNEPPPPANPPNVTSCSPNNADQGDTLNVTVSGSDFVATPTADFGSGITINSVTYVTSSSLTVNITVSVAATPGSRNVTITNPDTQNDTLVSGFTVNTPSFPPPDITSCTPNSASRNTTLNVTLGGTDFVATPSVVFSGTKVITNSVTYISSTTLTVNLTVQKGSARTARNITVTHPALQSDTLVNGFTVT